MPRPILAAQGLRSLEAAPSHSTVRASVYPHFSLPAPSPSLVASVWPRRKPRSLEKVPPVVLVWLTLLGPGWSRRRGPGKVGLLQPEGSGRLPPRVTQGFSTSPSLTGQAGRPQSCTPGPITTAKTSKAQSRERAAGFSYNDTVASRPMSRKMRPFRESFEQTDVPRGLEPRNRSQAGVGLLQRGRREKDGEHSSISVWSGKKTLRQERGTRKTKAGLILYITRSRAPSWQDPSI